MVSQEQPITPGTIPGNRFVAEGRGLREQVVTTEVAPMVTSRTPAFSYFWGAAIAGTLFAITFSVMSYALMYGFGVGIANGALALTWGAAVWIVITTDLAYLLGGMIAGRLNSLDRAGWLSGITVWGLSIPLVSVLLAVLAGGAGILARFAPQVTSNAGIVTYSAPNGVWTAFITLIIGLFCAAIGGSAGALARGGER